MAEPEPQPVHIVAPTPVEVEIVPPLKEQLAELIPPTTPVVPPRPPPPKLATTENPSLQATTTSEDDRRTAGQRKINLIWEYTQLFIAVSVVVSSILYAFALSAGLLKESTGSTTFFIAAFNLVVGFYFGRTNHARMGDRNPSTGKEDR